MASSTLLPFFSKSRMSASDFQPFSLKLASTANRGPTRNEERKSTRDQLVQDDLNVFNFCPEQIVLDRDEHSSSEDEDSDDEDDFQSKPSSSSGSTGKTSKISSSNGAKSTKSSDKENNIDNQSSPKFNTNSCVVKDTTDGKTESEEMQGMKTSSSITKAEIMSRIRNELFVLPGDNPNDLNSHESSEEDNIIEAAFGQLSSSPDTKTTKEVKKKDKETKAKEKETKAKEKEAKAKMLNCPVCGMVVMEKSSTLLDHYKLCHTPQRMDLDSLGFIPTHRHTDGTAFVRLENNQRLSGHQCFVCYRICRNSRELRLHWQLHKVYVTHYEARFAVDTENEKKDEDTDDDALVVDVEKGSDALIQMDTLYNVKLDVPLAAENEFWNSDVSSTDEEDEADYRELEARFHQNALIMARKIRCGGVSKSPDRRRKAKGRKRRKKSKSANAEKMEDSSEVEVEASKEVKQESLSEVEVECCRRCPDCDIVFVNAVTCSQHRLRDHGTKLMYRCVREECRKVFHHYQAYRDHHRQVHRQRGFICSICNDHFSVYGQLMAHRRSQHRFLLKNHPKITCTQCHTAFPSDEMLKAHHEISKMGEILVKLEHQDFFASSILQNQVRCLICMMVFDDHSQFESHIDDHFNRHFVCPSLNCDVVGDNLMEFKLHFLSHYDGNEMSRSCPRCRKTSVDVATNHRHMDTCVHHCRLCKKAFILDEEMYYHFFKNHHWLILVCPFCYEVIPSIREMVEHHKQYHLMLHAVRGCEEPRINLCVFDQESAGYFPDLMEKIPDLACGQYGFVSLGTQPCPQWWKLPAEERMEKRANLAKRQTLRAEVNGHGDSGKRARKTVELLVPEVKIEPSEDARDDQPSRTGRTASEKNKKRKSPSESDKSKKVERKTANRRKNSADEKKLIVKFGRRKSRAK